jgi:Glycosyltransferase
MIDFYPEFSNLSEETIKNGNAMEQAALANCKLAIYASDWAAKTAYDNYDVDRKKIKVVPLGANLDSYPIAKDIKQAIALRNFDTCKLLLVGVEWNRKGGDIALSVAEILNKRGLITELHVVGCQPPPNVPAFVKTYGFLSKNNQQQNELLSYLYKTSTFFILPSRAECSAIVLAEASAFGLPAVATNVGGTSTVVRNGTNGRTFEIDTFSEECATFILETMSSRETYQKLCLSSLVEATNRLNWRAAAASVINLIESSGILKQCNGQGLH